MDGFPSNGNATGRFEPVLDSVFGSALELRILDGPQLGARAAVESGVPFVVGALRDGDDAAASCDIVLNEPGAAGHVRARVTVDRHDALLEVLDGEVELDGRRHAAGRQVAWPMHAPLRIGAATVAFGRADVERWPGPSDAGSNGAPAPAPVWATRTARRAPLLRRPEVWLAATGAVVLLACTGSLLAAHRVAAPPPADPKPHLDVGVDEQMLHNVVEVFRVNGIAVQARLAAPGRVEAEAAERDPDRLARAEEVVRRDVRGLEKLEVLNTVPAEPPEQSPVADDPNKRIASLVPAPAEGGPGYIVTADGARYFVGALLPSGYRIAQIEAQRLQLERDGRQSTLNF